MQRRSSIALFVLVAACSGESSDAGVATPRDGGTRDAGMVPEDVLPLDVDEEVVDGLGNDSLSGDNALLRLLPDGTPAIAYGYVAPGEAIQRVRFATRNGPDDWTTELVARPGEATDTAGTLVGLGFAIVGGQPHVVYLGGDDDDDELTPFATDLALAVRDGAGSWTESILVNTSGESNGDCTSLQNICNDGNVVGSHPAIAARPGGGYAVVFRDTHGGFALDDTALADVEVFRSGQGPTLVDPERSGGPFSDITHLSDGTVVMAYDVPSPGDDPDRVGLWVAYADGSGFTRVKIASSGTSSKVALITSPSDDLFLAFFDDDNADLVFAESSDGGATWTTSVIDASGKTGLHPSIDVDADGQPVIAYTYCGRTSDRDCPGSLGPRSEVRVARRSGGGWQRYRVADGQGFGGVGFFTSVRVDADGKIAVAFQDTTNADLLYVKER